MIWQLMKRDYAWKCVPWTAALFAALGHRDAMLVLFPMLAVPTWLATQMFLRCTVYEAALPVRGRELWLSRVLSRLALLWIPVMAAAAVTLVIPGKDLLTLLEAASVWTVALLVLTRLQLQESPVMRLEWIVSAGLLVLGVNAVPLLSPKYGFHAPPAGMVLTVCGIASVALFAWGWAAVPGVFQVAPAKREGTAKHVEAGPSRFKWAPVFSTIYGWNCVMPLAMAFLMTFGQTGTAFIYVPIYFAMTGTLGRWLTAVPLASKGLFRITIAPMLAGVVLGGVIHTFVKPQHYMTQRAVIVEIAGDLTTFFILAFFCEFPGWNRLGRTPNWIRLVPMIAGVGILAVLPIFTDPWAFDRAARYLADLLPEDWRLFGLALAMPVAGTYWIAERTFAEFEYTNLFVKSRTGG